MSDNLQKKYEWIQDPRTGIHHLCRHRDAGLDSDCELASDDEKNKGKTPQYGTGAGWYSMNGYGPFGGYPEGQNGFLGRGYCPHRGFYGAPYDGPHYGPHYGGGW